MSQTELQSAAENMQELSDQALGYLRALNLSHEDRAYFHGLTDAYEISARMVRQIREPAPKADTWRDVLLAAITVLATVSVILAYKAIVNYLL